MATHKLATTTNTDENLLTHPDDIYRVLHSIVRKRSVISLRFKDNRRNHYSSMILDANLEEQYFIIDAVNNDTINQRLNNSDHFDIIAFEDLPVIINHNIAKPAHSQLWENAFMIDFPEAIDYRQRRQCFRAPIIYNRQAEISIYNNNRLESVNGHPNNLSASGLGATLEGYIQPALSENELFDDCAITVPGGLELRCAMSARHPRYDKTTGQTHCGFEFVALDSVQQKMVDRFVLSLQRQARVHQQRV